MRIIKFVPRSMVGGGGGGGGGVKTRQLLLIIFTEFVGVFHPYRKLLSSHPTVVSPPHFIKLVSVTISRDLY